MHFTRNELDYNLELKYIVLIHLNAIDVHIVPLTMVGFHNSALSTLCMNIDILLL